MTKFTVELIEKIKTAIENARSVDEVARLELALQDQDVSKVMDLLSGGANALKDAWETSAPEKRRLEEPTEPLPKQTKLEPAPVTKAPIQKAATSIAALSLLIDRAKQDPAYLTSTAAPANPEGWRSSAECSGFGGHSTLVIECGTALTHQNKIFQNDTLVRVLVIDFETEATLLDELVSPGAEVVDARTEYTETTGLEPGLSLAAVQERLLALMKGPETLVISHSAGRTAHCLKLKHTRWLPLSLLFKISEKNRKSDNFHVRAHLSPAQLRQTMLGEPGNNWASETVATVCLGALRMVKLACVKFPKLQLEVDVPRSPESLWLQKIPSASTAESLAEIFGDCAIGKIIWKFEVSENDWMGETQATFASTQIRDQVFEKIPTLADVYVSWEATDQVSEEGIKALAGKYGKVCGVRMPQKLAEGGRPFGFVSFLRSEDAAKFAEVKRIKGPTFSLFARPSQSGPARNPFKRVPVANDKILEVFKM